MDNSWIKLREDISLVFPKIATTFNAPATKDQLIEFEKEIGVEMPDVFCNLYLSFNGQSLIKEIVMSDNSPIEVTTDVTFLEFYRVLSLDEILRDTIFLSENLEDHDIAQGEEMNGAIFWSKKYLPFAANINGGWLSFDCKASDYKITPVAAGGYLYINDTSFPPLDIMPLHYLNKLSSKGYEIHLNSITFK